VSSAARLRSSSSYRPFEARELDYLAPVEVDDREWFEAPPRRFEAPHRFEARPFDMDDESGTITVTGWRPVSRWGRRLRRLFGAVVVGGVLYGCFAVVRRPEVRTPVLAWITMGHEGAARSVIARVEPAIDWTRRKYDELTK
jgi:hypothetical protein